MSSIKQFPKKKISHSNLLFSKVRSTIETVFYGNNVSSIESVTEAYHLAKNSLGTITTNLPVFKPETLGLPVNSRVLVTNDGNIVGRTAAARRIIGQPGIDEDYYSGILREAAYQLSKKRCRAASIGVGLADDFMLRGHLLLPEGFEGNLYSYLLNFQFFDETFNEQFDTSVAYDEGDIFILADPDWTHPSFPQGLVLIDPLHNTAAILGLRYFGELKKATLTLAWATAHRNGFIACHGGMKQYKKEKGVYTMAAFGLSGSGKSTITLAKNNNGQEVTVLHDDAFIISKKDGSSIALEPSYFDKTQDYPMADPAVTYFLTCQNVGVTLDEEGNKVLITEDIRNGNGRTVKSAHATPNRKNQLTDKIDAVYWIMKDDSLPPVIKITDPILGALFGVTLATKRSSAENLDEAFNQDQLVIEPFANPFRCYPLAEDYEDFRALFQQNTDCYILNTGHFDGKKVTVSETLESIEKIVEGQAEFLPFGTTRSLQYLPVSNHHPDFNNLHYLEKVQGRLKDRLAFIQKQQTAFNGYNALPEEAAEVLTTLIAQFEM
ncbi:phosphoenolpyruvate carboxykinase (ATP) [Enterococcus sp. BWR-S5]|uniref:phosphoenolpyruvate carboxykinase (ATP) n=1 Tax=Enterococcus sp. BWR-S5 TaxID=2787714 RepID=UPI001924A31A|nr:phosphoenolpyruvate carboxykinase (ATP) [Enterococcus sp. BWR-S5]MBL1225936.1 phosphoenolpyruvate carboxykinase (ATP) [Enterococcus sp. BWR-S5]